MHADAGELVQHDDATWQIDKVIDVKSVLATAVDGGASKVLLVKDLQTLPRPSGEEQRRPPKPLDSIGDADWTIAQERHEAIRPLLALPQH